MKPNPQRYIDLNHSGSNGAKAPPQSPNGYPGTEAPFGVSLGLERRLSLEPILLPCQELIWLTLGLKRLWGCSASFWSRGSSLEPSSSIRSGDSFWSPPGSSGALGVEPLEWRLLLETLWLFWSGGSSSEPLWIPLEQGLLLEPPWLFWSPWSGDSFWSPFYGSFGAEALYQSPSGFLWSRTSLEQRPAMEPF